MNGDGISDMIVGATYSASAGRNLAGAAYVLFGRPQSNPFPAAIDLLSFVFGSNGFMVMGGAEGDQLDYSVSGAGDVNGDGIDDFIVGAVAANPTGREDAGAFYVIFGHSSDTSFSNIDAGAFASGTIGFRVSGAVSGDNFGWSVAAREM